MRHTLARDRLAVVEDPMELLKWRPTGSSGAQSPLGTINVTRALVPPRVRGPRAARNPRPWPTAAGLVEVVGGGVFAVNLPASAKGRQRIAHQRAALLPAVENQTVPGEFLFRSFDGTARASGEAEPPGPRKFPALRGKRP